MWRKKGEEEEEKKKLPWILVSADLWTVGILRLWRFLKLIWHYDMVTGIQEPWAECYGLVWVSPTLVSWQVVVGFSKLADSRQGQAGGRKPLELGPGVGTWLSLSTPGCFLIQMVLKLDNTLKPLGKINRSLRTNKTLKKEKMIISHFPGSNSLG